MVCEGEESRFQRHYSVCIHATQPVERSSNSEENCYNRTGSAERKPRRKRTRRQQEPKDGYMYWQGLGLPAVRYPVGLRH